MAKKERTLLAEPVMSSVCRRSRDHDLQLTVHQNTAKKSNELYEPDDENKLVTFNKQEQVSSHIRIAVKHYSGSVYLLHIFVSEGCPVNAPC